MQINVYKNTSFTNSVAKIVLTLFLQMSIKDDSVFLPNEEDRSSKEKESAKEFETAFCEFRAEIMPYTKDETRKMIEWIVNNQSFHLVEGDTIWKRMEATGLLEERSWMSMKTHFHENVLTFLDEIKVSRDVKWKLEACLKNPDALEFLCDADIDSEPESYSSKIQFDKVMRKNKPKESIDNRKESSDGDDEKAPTSVPAKRFVRKRSKVPADKFDESIRLSSFSTRSSNDASKENDVDNGVEPSLEALLNNSNIPQISQLRESSGASNSLDISKPIGDKSTKVSDVSQSNKPLHEKVDSEVPSLVDDVPTITEFSAGLKEAGSKSMSQERELSLMGVTSTIRNGVDDPPSVSNGSRKSTERVHPASEPAAPRESSPVGTPPQLGASSRNCSDMSCDDLDEDGNDNSEGDNGSNDCDDESIEGIPKGVSKLQQLEVQLGTDSVDKVYLVIKGLPKNIDFENVEFVNASCNSEDVNDNSANPEPEREKRKLKIICLDSVENINKSKEWKKEGSYGIKFRTPYSKKEDLSIITFLKDWKRKKGSLSLGGNRIWKIMDKRAVCRGRTWESMKERWRGYLADNLDKFNMSSI